MMRFLSLAMLATLLSCGTPERKVPENPPQLSREERVDAALDPMVERLCAAAGGQAVAILPFLKEGRDYEPAVSRYVGPRLAARLVGAGVHVLVREELDKIIDELELQLSALFTDDGQRRLGRLAGADALVMGSVRDVGVTGYELDVKLVAVATGAVLTTARATVMKADLPVGYGGL
ncbi:MAG: CsgG/HfaB family protein [Planctomycetota bacterium]